jgi:hypothetical protein
MPLIARIAAVEQLPLLVGETMPRYILTSQARHPQHDKLVKRLARELATPSDLVQPLILEEHLPPNGSRRVYVIWNKWKDLELEERSEIIDGAYEQAEGKQAAAKVLIATGLTAQEALAYGLLPYKVERLNRSSDNSPSDAYRKGVAKEAGFTLLGSKARELRYARLEDAEQARDRLKQALPGSSWVVVKEEPVES